MIDDYDRAFRVADETTPVPLRPPVLENGKRVPVDPDRWGLDYFGTTDRELLHYDEVLLQVLEDLDAPRGRAAH